MPAPGSNWHCPMRESLILVCKEPDLCLHEHDYNQANQWSNQSVKIFLCLKDKCCAGFVTTMKNISMSWLYMKCRGISCVSCVGIKASFESWKLSRAGRLNQCEIWHFWICKHIPNSVSNSCVMCKHWTLLIAWTHTVQGRCPDVSYPKYAF